MALTEIAISGQPDMQAVYASLGEASINFDPQERRSGVFNPEEQPSYVFVDSVQVGHAVSIINDLGYETDEDETEEEDEDYE